MKIAGWICLVFGVLSFFGAALKSNSVFGPLFWIGLGAFLLYRANNKDDSKKRDDGIDHHSNERIQTHESNNRSATKFNQNDIPKLHNQQLESLEDIQAQLSLQQREAAMCLISFFGGYNNNPMSNTTIMLFKQSAFFFGFPESPTALSNIMSKYTDADTVIDIVLTIKPIKAKEFLLLTCYDLIKPSGKTEAYNILYNVANEMGYDKTKFEQLISLYQ